MTQQLANKLEIVNPPENISVTMTSERLSLALSDEQKKRDLIKTYIQQNLVPDVDYGKINMNGRMSKDCLFKPGAEKVCSLLHLNPVFKIDTDLTPILGDGVIPYICQLINRHTGEVEGEGRGSCSLKEKQGNANVAIKIAQKRAQIDAVLRVAALSDQFTQDLEDMGAQKTKVEPYYPKSSPPTDDLPPFETYEEEVDDGPRCTFGKNKGKPWSQLTINQLKWYKENFEAALQDESKSQYHDTTRRQLQEVLDALEIK
jgi:hypothetical protein